VQRELLEKTQTSEDKGSVFNQRFEVTINDKIKWKGGTTALGNDSAYIAFSKARMKEINVQPNDEVDVILTRDTSEYGFDVPEEFSEVLEQDNEAKSRFESLTMGKRRATIYLILQVKSSTKKIEKSLSIMENLKRAPVGNITMRHILGKDLD